MAKFSKRHYEIVADSIGYAKEGAYGLDDLQYRGAKYILEELIDNLSKKFVDDNPAFDAERFKRACGF